MGFEILAVGLGLLLTSVVIFKILAAIGKLLEIKREMEK